MQSTQHSGTATFTRGDEKIETRTSQALEIWQFINIVLLTLVTGVFWGHGSVLVAQ